MHNLNKKLNKAVKHKIKKQNNRKTFIEIFSNEFLSVGWNFVLPIVLCVFIGHIISKKMNNDIQIFMLFVMIGLFLGFINCYFFLKKIYFDKIEKKINK